MSQLPVILTMQAGEVAVVRCEWNRDGVPYDPPSVTCRVRPNLKPVVVLETTREETGIYTALVKGEESGTYHVLFIAEGVGDEDGAQEGLIQVLETAFPVRS